MVSGPAPATRHRYPDIERFHAKVVAGELAGHYYVMLLGLKTFDTAKLLERIREGLSYSAWERFARNLSLPKEAITSLVQISPRTLSRRKEEGRLHPDESDRLLRATRLFAQTLELFEGDAEQARQWLISHQPALGGSTPLAYAVTDVGIREVEALIGRLEHGIPS
jgi:putative toxin-antitoxin system antitoxin component (TIGR02293 family)